MADISKSIFNKKATEKLRSPDDLDKYVRVTNPSVWVILLACIALLIGLFSWGFFGTVASSVTVTGTCEDGVAMCLLSAEDASKVHVDDAATIDGHPVTVSYISPTPASREELRAILDNDYLVATLMKDDWAYVVMFEGDVSDLADYVPVDVNITVDRMAPISLVLGGQS